ncbi:predicted protein, partial [Nematostella vectensis]
MKIICAGATKTGTKSMAKALRMLGYTVYDIAEQLGEFADEWTDLIIEGKLPDFKSMFHDIDAITDYPGSFFFEEILAAFPQAKVVLTVRDEDAWARSLSLEIAETAKMWSKNSVLAFLSPTFAKLKRISLIMETAMCGNFTPKSTFIHRKFIHMHNNRVRINVPKDQLLVFSVTQGWQPLCDFLGHAIPTPDFPHENK